MFQRAGAASERLVRRFMPDPFALVLLLTLVSLGLGVAVIPDVAGAPPRSLLGRASEVVSLWTSGFGNAEILKFGFQIILIVVTGEAIAESPPAQKLLARLSALPKTAPQALLVVTTFAVVSGWVHWGFGLIASALLARAVGRSFRARGIPLHYPLLGTGAYTAMLLWHAGLTASAPLLMNTQKNFVSDVLGEKAGKVPLTETIFAPYNLLACALLIVLVPLLVTAMHPAKGQIAEAPEPEPEAHPGPEPERREPTFATPAEHLDKRRWLTFLAGALGLSFLGRYVREHGFDLNHNVVNTAFLMLGMLLHDSPVAYAKAVKKSAGGVAGVILQFPFYGGILEIMTKCGLSDRISHAFVALATARTLPLFTFAASVVTKSFVPSGAGEWAVEGPPMLRAAKELGVPYGKITMAVAYGNMLGNMYQPFWSLPLLGVMGLRAKDIMGYCLILFFVAMPILAAALYFG